MGKQFYVPNGNASGKRAGKIRRQLGKQSEAVDWVRVEGLGRAGEGLGKPPDLCGPSVKRRWTGGWVAWGRARKRASPDLRMRWSNAKEHNNKKQYVSHMPE